MTEAQRFSDALTNGIQSQEYLRRRLLKALPAAAAKDLIHGEAETATVEHVGASNVRSAVFGLITAYVEKGGVKHASRPTNGQAYTDQKGKSYTKLTPWTEIDANHRSRVASWHKAQEFIRGAKQHLRSRLNVTEGSADWHLYNALTSLSLAHKPKADVINSGNLFMYHMARYYARSAGGDYRLALVRELGVQIAVLSAALQDSGYAWDAVEEAVERAPVTVA